MFAHIHVCTLSSIRCYIVYTPTLITKSFKRQGCEQKLLSVKETVRKFWGKWEIFWWQPCINKSDTTCHLSKSEGIPSLCIIWSKQLYHVGRDSSFWRVNLQKMMTVFISLPKSWGIFMSNPANIVVLMRYLKIFVHKPSFFIVHSREY